MKKQDRLKFITQDKNKKSELKKKMQRKSVKPTRSERISGLNLTQRKQ